jgi:hypothetical protein
MRNSGWDSPWLMQYKDNLEEKLTKKKFGQVV